MKLAVKKLIDEAVAIETEAAQEAGSIGFMARMLVQATLPHRKVAGSEYSRVNGNYTLSIMTPSAIGIPYGTIPRLLLSWISTEAVKTQSRELELGESLSAFMRELGLVPTGGRWGSITRLKDQTKRLFASTITAYYEGDNHYAIKNRSIADDVHVWWDAKAPEQIGLWKSNIILSEPFYKSVIERPVPIDMRAIKALKRSPMALDIYCWLTYRASSVQKPTTIPWVLLAMQFGASYERQRAFKASFIDALKKVGTVYSGANFNVTEIGLVIKPSLPHVAKRTLK